MRYTLFFFVAILFMANSNAQEVLQTEINSVKVYIEGAELQRSGKIDIKKGRNEVVIEELSAVLDAQTIQVKTPNATLLSVRHEKDYINQSTPEKVKSLIKLEHQLYDSLNLLKMQKSILSKEAALLEKNANVSNLQNINGTEFRGTLEYLEKQFKANVQAQFKLDTKIKKVENQIDRVVAQISSSSNKQRETSKIYMTILSDSDQELNLSLSYAIRNAGWFPKYDIRAKNTSSPLDITYKAMVYQNSGIDWKDIQLTLSSGSLENNAVAPVLFPTYLDKAQAYNAPQSRRIKGIVKGASDGQPLSGVNILVKGTTIGVSSGSDGRFDLQIPSGRNYLVARYLGYKTVEKAIGVRDYYDFYLQEDVTELGEVVVTSYKSPTYKRIPGNYDSQMEEQTEAIDLEILEVEYQTSFVYEIVEPYNIPSSGQPEMVNIFTKTVDADIYYSTIPKVKNAAFLVADIPDWEQLKLMDGESNLYIEDAFVGKSIIDTQQGGDTLNLSIGKDNGFIITRDRLKEFEKKKSFSNKKQDQRTYEITLTSTKSTPARVKVFDQLPLVSTKDFAVKPIDLAGAELDEETGLLTWDLTLQPGEKRTIRFSFNLEYPKDRYITYN